MMAHHIRTIEPSLRALLQPQRYLSNTRSFATSALRLDEAGLESISTTPLAPPPLLDTDAARRDQQSTNKPGQSSASSRRLRGATRFSKILRQPYQCYQEALKIIQADREVKLKQIKLEQERIARVKAQDLSQTLRKKKLNAMEKHLEYLKVLTDINDPEIKRRFEERRGTSPQPPPLSHQD